MRILIDLRCLQSPPPRGGVGVFAEKITRALIAQANAECKSEGAELHEFLFFANGLTDPRRFLPQFEAPNARWVITRWPNKLWNGASFVIRHSPFTIPDVIFLPNLNFLPSLPKRARLIVAVHDLSFEHFPNTFTWKQRFWHRMVRPRELLARADAIIAVSETTKRDVMEIYGIPEEKIYVMYPGVENAERVAENPRPDLSSIIHRSSPPYILSLTAFEPRKNIEGLIAGFEKLLTLDSQLSTHLVLAGAHGSAEQALRAQIARSPARERIRFLGSVSENEKRALLARAACFVYPSFWEGFGFPPLEAMAADVPVVASANGALPEILGDAALLVDPLNPSAIAGAISRVLSEDALRADLIRRGRQRVLMFQWKRAAEQTLKILTA